MIEESTTAQETMQHGIKGLIYGESGAGKTSLCGTTLAEQTLILSAENGLLPLKGLNIKVWKIKTVEDLIEAHARLYSARDNWQYRYVHIDSLSEIAEVVLANAKRIVKDPRQAYGELTDKMMMTVREFRDLPGRDVWFYAKAEYDKDEISGMATKDYVDQSVAGLASEAFVGLAVAGLASEEYVDAKFDDTFTGSQVLDGQTLEIENGLIKSITPVP